MIDYNQLNLIVDQNNITNLEDVLSYLEEIEITEEVEQYLETLLNKVKYAEITNKDDFVNAITAKILQYQATKASAMDNQSSLRAMQEMNNELKNIKIIETSKHTNDSKRDIEYLAHTNEFGETEVLVCESKTTLNDYLQNHADTIASMTDEEVFNHFKKHVHREVNFYQIAEYDEEMNKETFIREEEIIRQEQSIIEEYAQKYGLAANIEVGVDHFGERLYRVGDGVFKFRTSKGKRELETLVYPSINKDNTDALLAELDGSQNIVPDTPEVTISNTTVANYAAIETIDYNSFDKQDFIDLTRKRDIYEIELSAEELHRLNIYVKFLIETMVDRAKNPNSDHELEEMLLSYMEGKNPENDVASLEENYQSITSGVAPENSLSELDKEFARRYIENKQYIQSLGLKKKQDLILELKPDNKSGITTLVVLLEIAVLAMFIILLLSLDI